MLSVKTRCLLPTDPAYPALVALRHPRPPPLYVRGALPTGPAVAVVGTREPSGRALQFAEELGEQLATAGVVVWSGGALGIDRAAHEGAMANGTTVAVLGSGFRRPSPPSHRELYDDIAARGALLSAYPETVGALRHQFLERNAVLVAAVSLVVVVECMEESGARHAARTARELGTPVATVPQAPWVVRGQGARAELRLGAHPVFDASDVLALLGRLDAPAPRGALPRRARARQLELPTRAPEPDLSQEARRVVEAIRAGARSPDAVAHRVALDLPALSALLLDLQLQGVIREGLAGYELP